MNDVREIRAQAAKDRKEMKDKIDNIFFNMGVALEQIVEKNEKVLDLVEQAVKLIPQMEIKDGAGHEAARIEALTGDDQGTPKADPNCNLCEGTGVRNVPNGPDDFDAKKCLCVK